MKWLGFIVLLTALLIPMPVMAIGVSPYSENITVYANSYTELEFTVTGSSEVDLSLEGIPLTVEPSHTLVVDNKVTARIIGSLSVPSGVYEGYLVLLESGQQVGAGVKVSLTVNHINSSQSVSLTTTVLQSSSGSGWSGGGYTNWQYVDSNQPRQPSPYVPPVTNSLPPTPPTYPTYDGTGTTNTEPVPPQTSSNMSSVFIAFIIIGGLLLLYALYIHRKSKSQ